MKPQLLISLPLALLLTLPTFAQEPGAPTPPTPPSASSLLNPWSVSQLRSVTQVGMSADGERAFYALSVPRSLDKKDYQDGAAWSEIHLQDANGSRPFLTGSQNVSQVGFSPDGKALLFLAKRSGDEHTSLYRISLQGGEAQRLFGDDFDVARYALSGDQKTLFVSATPALSKQRKALEKKGFRAQVYEEDWRNVQLYRVRLGGGQPVALPLSGSVSEFHLHPDGKTLAVALAPNPGVDSDLMFRRIHLVDAQSGKVLKNLNNPGKLGHFEWSPDGLHLAAVSAADLNDPDAGRLLVYREGAWSDLLPGLEGQVRRFAWIAPDKLRVLVHRGLSSEVWDVSLNGSSQQRLQQGEVVFTDLSCSADGRRSALVGESYRHPGEAFWMEDGAAPRRRTRVNPSLDRVRLARQEAVSFRARDGQTIQGTLIHPLDGKPNAPLIMFVHGGPESHVINGWLTSYAMPGQIAAARGFAVFYPNYRGSTGRGVAFSKLGQKDPAGREFDDLVDAVDELVRRGVADKSRVGITGGSYGGYATAWCSTFYSERFAAGVMSVGISDKISKSGTTDIPQEEYLVHARQHPWDAWEFFRERSPISHVQKSKTPLLIMHGKDDPRVHPSQSLELYRYLKTAGKAPVRLVLYPGEGHGNRKAAARYDFNLRMLEWMEHYLKGPGGSPPAYELDYQIPSPKRAEMISPGEGPEEP